MQFTLTIKLGGGAMRTQADIATAIKQYVDSFGYEQAEPTIGDFGPLWDENGNRVGAWAVEEPEPQRPGTIMGKIVMLDGTPSDFSLEYPDGDDYGAGWQQWGAIRERLYRTSVLVEAMQNGITESEFGRTE